MPDASAPRFCVLVPVKPTARAKSRLSPLGEEARRALVTAFAVDTVTAALESPLVGAVLVVTDDHVLAAGIAGVGAEVVPDAVADDLNESLVQAAAEAGRRWPELAPVALCADLPALRPEELTRALATAAEHRSAFVPDAQGGGTTMVAAATREEFRPRFGPGSREAHVAAGCHELVDVDVPTLRHDVDTPEDLRDALQLGVGAHTSLAATGLRL
ncbi:MAG TPA: 2-phospho-L-lactate guanylyltransferase [Nocardioidaceae bacterium]